MGKLWLIGEAPTRANGPPFTGRAGRTLSEWLQRDLEKTFALANVLDAWPGEGPNKGAKFPRQEAREGVERLYRQLDVQDWVIVVGGRNFKTAWRCDGKSPYTWYIFGGVSKHDVPIRLKRMLISWIPHPSGINQHWNNPQNINRLRSFVNDAVRLREAIGG